MQIDLKKVKIKILKDLLSRSFIMIQNNTIKFEQNEGLAHFDNFIEEQFVKANFSALSAEEQQAHKQALVKAVMDRIFVFYPSSLRRC